MKNKISDEDEMMPPIDVPYEQLQPETVAELIESFILREGTDYGAVEAGLETKKAQVRRQLEHGEIKIVFDQNEDTVTLITLTQWKKLGLSPQHH